MTDKEDSFTSDDWKCPVTDKPTLDDCHIELQFGYGSDKDMWTYKFTSINDIVGKKVLETIQSMMPEGRSVEHFGRDTMAEHFDEDWWKKLSKEELAQYRKDCGLGIV